jgi:class 3 adenylate cyclase
LVRAAATPVVLWASTIAGRDAIEFAIAQPDAVSHLILYDTLADADANAMSVMAALQELAQANWEMAARTIADTNGRREFPKEAAQLGEWYFRSETAERYVAYWAENLSHPSAPDLSRVMVPSLVLHRIADPIIPFAKGHNLAAGIPNARFIPLQGKGHLFCLGDYHNILLAVDNFLGDRAGQRERLTSTSEPLSSGFRTILFTDIVGHTEMMQRLGDAKGREVLRDHERITRETLRAHGGTEIKTDGDSFMVSFGSVTQAMDCAIALQRAFAAHTESMPEPLHVRVGLNAGEPIEEDGDLFGSTVILASRIAEKAGAGEILVPDTVRGLLSGKGFLFADRGEFVPKGFEDAVRLYEVRWTD